MKDFSVQSRRDFLASAATAAGSCMLVPGLQSLQAAEADKPIKVATLITSFFRASHAHVILENFLYPYLFNGKVTQPGMQVVSFYVDQFHENDMARGIAKQFQIPIYGNIAEALCLGGQQLAVDAVLLIGEHGQYPTNAK